MNRTNNAILVVNSGSTSLKLALYFQNGTEISAQPAWSMHSQQDVQGALRLIADLWTGDEATISDPRQIVAVGHRVVHGGKNFSAPAILSKEVLGQLRKLVELAPLHQPANICGIELITELLPHAVHVAVFDTAYFHDMPLGSTVYAVPYEWYEKLGIRRYGFHGISHEYCAGRAAEIIDSEGPLRVITCHLGGGASITANLDSKSIATTMGFTPLEGVVMGTRSGSIDPGIILHLLRNEHFSLHELDHLLNHESGLKGISGISADVHELEARASAGDDRAKLALDIYVRSIAMHISSMVAALGGTDAIVFTAGVGEHSSYVRSEVCSRLAYLGLELDPQGNEVCQTDCVISKGDTKIAVLVIEAREEWVIAQASARLLASPSP